MQRDTIFALSSGAPPSAIAIMRISGPDAGGALAALAGALPVPRAASLRTIHDGEEVLDRALVLWLPGPATVTGEDVAELHLHGSRAVVRGVEQALARRAGMRAAEAGEFTRRALDHGRLDLTEVEGLADLLAAETATQRRAALELSGGALSRLIERWRTQLLTCAAQVEAQLDFAEEGDVGADDGAWRMSLQTLVAELKEHLAQPPAERLRDGVRVVLAGPPNAGKSTLLNALAGREAAITSPHAGTTRDLIEVPVDLDGIPFLLTDTAGLRDTEDEIERLGVERAERALKRSDLILWLGDGEPPVGVGPLLRLHARADLYDRADGPADRLPVSSVTGAGVSEVRAWMQRYSGLERCGVALHRRHRDLLSSAMAFLEGATASSDLVVTAEELRSARGAMDAITGRAGLEEMLDQLFAGFCVGK